MSADEFALRHNLRFILASVASLAALALAAALPSSPARLDMVLWALYFPMLAALTCRLLPREQLLLQNPGANEPRALPAWMHSTGFPLAILLLCVGTIVATGLVLIANPLSMMIVTDQDLPPNSLDPIALGNPPVNGSPLLALAVVANALTVLGKSWNTPDWFRLARRLGSAPWIHDSHAPGEWVRMAGTVEDPTPIDVEHQPAAFALVTDTEIVGGSNPNIEVQSLQSVGSFVVCSGSTRVELDPSRIYWSRPSTHTHEGTASSGNKRVLTREYLPLGAKVLVLGRLRAQVSPSYRDAPLALSGDARSPVLLFRTDAPDALITLYLTADRLLRNRTRLVVALLVATLLVFSCMSLSLPPLHLLVASD